MPSNKDILVMVDCANYTAKLFAADNSIVVKDQGKPELKVKVLVGTRLTWTVVPQQLSEGIDGEGQWHAIISRVALWDNSQKQGQGDASKYLKNWEINDGGTDNPSYSSQGSIESLFQKNTNYGTDGQLTKELPVQALRIYRPFVACDTFLTGGRGEKISPWLAYTFYCKVYKNAKMVHEFHWDPYVQIYSP